VRGSSEVKAWCEAQLTKHEHYIVEHLEDMPEVRDWVMTTIVED
jgi:xylulose-5-phosphate/fructose-6-phosphate phosphoketolase